MAEHDRRAVAARILVVNLRSVHAGDGHSGEVGARHT
jgi:hypothetical protein